MNYRTMVICSLLFLVCAAQSKDLTTTNYTIMYQSGPKMGVPRMGQFSTLLSNGNVALFGGHGTNFVSLSSADIYNPTSKTFTLSSMQYIHDFGAVSDLKDGTWLIAGGAYDLGVAPGTNTAEIYNPGTGTFTACSTMVYPRCVCSAVRLASNNVLVVGGWYDQTSATYGELFNPSTKSFAATQALQTPRSNAVAIATNDSGAVVFGGYGYYGSPVYESVEYYNPKTNSFTQLQNHLFPNDSGWCTQIDMFARPLASQRLKNGQYLIYAWRQNPSQYTLGTFNPSAKSFARLPLATPLPGTDSIVFFKAPLLDTTKNIAYWFGMKPNTNPAVMQLYIIDLNTLTWQSTQPYTTSYFWSYAGMNLLPNGSILITGGTTSNDYYTNFTPVDNTLLVTITSGTGVPGNSHASSVPAAYSLAQNFPNPFNPSTVIRYELPEAGHVTLKLFDLIGREVATLVEGIRSAGSYELELSASNLRSGAYFYRLQSGHFTETRKLLLIK